MSLASPQALARGASELPTAGAGEDGASADVARGRVLVVDDNPVNRDLLVRRLERQGHEVVEAGDGLQALEHLRAGGFDVVLLDIMMPGLDGYGVLERLRAEPELAEVRVIMISAVDELESVVRCLRLGADDYLTKPFNPVLLRARLESSLARKRLHDRERLHARSLERELEIGREIQAEFLPEELPAWAGWDLAGCLHPARQCSGDFYDAFAVQGDARVALVVADVCDKGVGAALFMALCRTLLRAGSDAVCDPQVAPALPPVRLANDYIATNHGRSNMFATVFFGALDPHTGELEYVNAGHEPPLLVGSDGAVRRLAPTGPAVGLFAGVPFEVGRVRLEPGSRLVIFTDGVNEARSAAGELYGDERLVATVRAPSLSAADLVERIEGELRRHGEGVGPSDDVTLLVVHRANAASEGRA